MADLFNDIPSLDLHQFTQGTSHERQQFVSALGAAFNQIGFVAIKNHGLTDDLTEKLYTVVKEFFALPEEVKRQYDRPELHGQRGYTSKGKEHAKGRTTADLKEFYQIGQFVDDDDPIKENYPDNIWPEDKLPQMHPVAKEAYQTLESAGQQLLQSHCAIFGFRRKLLWSARAQWQ